MTSFGSLGRYSKLFGNEWYQVYDFIESMFYEVSRSKGMEDADRFADEVNEFLMDEGIGWQLVEGVVITRGTGAFEAVVKQATATLGASERPIAAKHLREAMQDLSRRPQADLPGAVYHSMGSLECVARDVCGDEKATLGEILKRYPGLLPRPLDEALAKIWGYASNEARHVLEGRETSRDEAELLVGLSAVLSTYLARKS